MKIFIQNLKYVIDRGQQLILVVFLLFCFTAMAQEDRSIGFASLEGTGNKYVAGGTTGGEGGEVVTVNNAADLEKYLTANEPYVILVDGPITISPKGKEIRVKSDKSLLGLCDNAAILQGGFFLGADVHNVIFRNLHIGETYKADDPDGKDQDWDGIQMDAVHHVWIDHCRFYKIGDGIIDSRKDSDYITVSYCILEDHNKAFGIGWTDNLVSKLTIHHNWFRRLHQRNPSCDNAYVHLYNNYLQDITSYGNYARGKASVVIENSIFRNVTNPYYHDATANLTANGNVVEGSTSGKRTSNGKAFNPRDYYNYTLDPTSQLKSILTEKAGPKSYVIDKCTGSFNSIAVELTAPDDNAAFVAPASFTLMANASTSNGSILKVEFYLNDERLVEKFVAPYNWDISNLSEGTYTVKAVAYDQNNNTSQDEINITVNVRQAPYGGTSHAIPGTIQFEDFDLGGNGFAYFDDSPGSSVSPAVNFRTDEDVDIENCTDIDGGYNIGWATAGEWLEYSVNITSAGTYDIEIRVACNGDGRTINLQIGDVVLNDIAIPNTGGWQTWETVMVNDVALVAGEQIMRVTMGDVSYVNLNYVEVKGLITSSTDKSLVVIGIHPNPTSSIIYISEATNWKLYNSNGTEVKEGFNDTKVDIGECPQGLYMLLIGNQMHKIIKN